MKKLLPVLGIPLLTIAVCVAVTGISGAETNREHIPPITLNSADVLSGNLLKGEKYTIDAAVINDGLFNLYSISSEYGDIKVESSAALINRINELNALATMEKIERSGVFKDSVVEGVKAPVKGAVDLVTSPVETTKGFVEGAGKFLSNMGRAIVSNDPHQDNVLKVAVGYDAAKRAYAFEFGINPYSDFTPVTDQLGKIARSAVAGGLVPRATMAAVDKKAVNVARVFGATKNLRKLVRDNSPGDLYELNKNKLLSIGVPLTQTESFLKNYNYDPQETTFLVGALEQVKNAQDMGLFIVSATKATNKSDAFLHRLIAQMIQEYDARVKPVKQILLVDGTLHFLTSGRELVLPVPTDYIFKTEAVTKKLSILNKEVEKMDKVSSKKIWFTGKVHESAQEMFESTGWKVVNRSELIQN